MTRSELIAKLSYQFRNMRQEHVEQIVNQIFEEIIQALKKGGRVELRGFGTFSLRKRDGRMGRNPRTGTAVAVEEKFVPFFKMGKELRHIVNATDPTQ